MKYTNKQNLPEPLVKAITKETYDKGESDYSVTELIGPPRKAEILRRHGDEIVVDVSTEIHRVMGQVVHEILERAGVPERRFAITIGDKIVSGSPDRFVGGELDDWKYTTAWRFKGENLPEDFSEQLNSYSELARENNHSVTKLTAHGILRDWSKLEMFRNRDYPRFQYVRREVEMWGRKKSGLFLRNRVILHDKAKIELPLCTKEERWARDDVWAVVKKGNKKATKLLSSPELAEQFISEQKKPRQYDIVFREGESVRCKAYCHAISFCSQGQEILKREKLRKENNTEEEVKVVTSGGGVPSTDNKELLKRLIERLSYGEAVELRFKEVEIRFGNELTETEEPPAPIVFPFCSKCGTREVESKKYPGKSYCKNCWRNEMDERR